MKTIFTLFIAGLIGSSAIASGNLRVNISSGSNELAEVEITNVKMSTFEIDVRNDRGELVFSKETSDPAISYKRNYDFSRLEDGTYYFTVKVDSELTETKLKIERGVVKIMEEKKMVDPVFVIDNKQLKMSFLNFDKENSTLIVYDKLRKPLYEKELKPDFVTHHGLDFSKAPRGKYEVILSSGNNVYRYDVLID